VHLPLAASRVSSLPDVPTLKELGYAIEYYVWVGLFALKLTPASIVTYLRGVLRRAAHTDQFNNTLANVRLDLAYLINRISPNSGTKTPPELKQPFDKSAECKTRPIEADDDR
jgi:tripartite-type tricarboxylate transporter receptor subunit TctC